MKKTDFKSYLKEEIISILSEESAEDIKDKAEAQSEFNQELEKTKELSLKERIKQAVLKELEIGNDLNEEEEELNEMANFFQLSKEQQDAIDPSKYKGIQQTVAQALKDMDPNTPFTKATIKAMIGKDPLKNFNAVLDAEGVGTLGRTDKVKPKSKSSGEGGGKRGRPSTGGSTSSKKKKQTTFKGAKTYYTGGNDDEPSDKDLRAMAKSGGKGIEGEANAKAKQSFRTRMIKNWLKDMKKIGVVDNANRILDKEKYAEEFAKYKPEIEKAVKDQFSALKENESSGGAVGNELDEKTFELIDNKVNSQDVDSLLQAAENIMNAAEDEENEGITAKQVFDYLWTVIVWNV